MSRMENHLVPGKDAFTETPQAPINGQKRKFVPLKLETIQRRLEVNVAYWNQVPELLKSGFTIEFLRTDPVSEEPGFFAVLDHKSSKQRLVVLAKGTEQAVPDKVDAGSALYAVATFSDSPVLSLPLLGAGKSTRTKVAKLRCRPPKPDLRWTIAINDRELQGERSALVLKGLPQAISKAFEHDATHVEIEISPALRTFFRTREQRKGAVSEALRPSGQTLLQWTKSNGLSFSIVNKAINRGDASPEVRKEISKLTGQTEAALWPAIKWE